MAGNGTTKKQNQEYHDEGTEIVLRGANRINDHAQEWCHVGHQQDATDNNEAHVDGNHIRKYLRSVGQANEVFKLLHLRIPLGGQGQFSRAVGI